MLYGNLRWLPPPYTSSFFRSTPVSYTHLTLPTSGLGRIYRGVVYDTSTIERILVSIVVRDKNAEKTVQAIIKAAQTGEIGDGRIFVIPIEDAIRIRTAERGDIALYNAEQER